MSTERKIKGLRNKIKSLLASFNLIKTFVEEYDEERDTFEVPVRLENLNRLWTDIQKTQSELESIDEASVDEQIKERTEFETAYYRVKGGLLAVNKSPVAHTVQSPSPSSSQIHVPSSHVRLPDVKLPVFSGNIDTWLNFHDLFVSLVHSSVELSNIQKFYYLRSSLAGEALKLIQSITISANNYLVAWNLLVEHYQNPLRLKQTYLDALFEFASLKRESATDLHSLVENFEANVKVLKQLGEKTEHWDLILIRMLSVRLDPTTRRDWEEFSSTQQAVTFRDLTSFIQRRVTVLQTIRGKAVDTPAPLQQFKKSVQRPIASHGASQIQPARKCVICSDHHPLYMCQPFSKLDVEAKEKEVRRHQLCRNCLRKGHQARDCPSSSSCRKCRGRHHSLLCPGENFVTVNSRTPESSQSPSASHSAPREPPRTSASATVHGPSSHASAGPTRRSVLLATAVVKLVDENGIEHAARALLDSGSECCFITEPFSQLIKAQRTKISIPISGIGQSSTYARYKITATVRSRVCDFSTPAEFLVLPKVTIDLPSASFDASSWDIPPGVQLADPGFYEANPVDIIIGAEVFFELFNVPGRIQLGEALPTLINSVLGWIVSGKNSNGTPKSPVIANVATISELHDLIEKFWAIEEDNSTPNYSVEEAACEDHFRHTVRRNSEGRYIVRLPIKDDVIKQLGDNRRTAVRRFRMLESRLCRTPELSQQYSAFMDEYLALGHMKQVYDHQSPPMLCYHMPHHAVVREDSTTTKVRVVFDASCKSPEGPSLNDALMVGPTVQQDIRSIILRSRIRRVMLIADAKQMYRQVLVDERDTPLQRIVRRKSPDLPLDTFELLTVTYGTASAPFLATRVLLQLANDEHDNFPEAAEVLRKDVYVDDLLSGANSIEQATRLRRQLDDLLSKGGIKSLGLHWEPASDLLKYKIEFPPESSAAPLTKRIALSQIARLFDPLGLLVPVVISAKIFMQALWTLKDENGKTWSWDEELPTPMKERWSNYMAELPLLNSLRIDRYLLTAKPAFVQYHFFSDASQHAYGACCYIRTADSSGDFKVALLTARSKVAPLKQQSIPRLELCGALLSAELYQKVSQSLELQGPTFFWVDSTTVLNWLNATPSTWTTFVANRVSKIQQSTQNCSWKHVAGHDNPADLLSRGISAENILENQLWWQGPEWLQLPQTSWPTGNIDITSSTEILLEAEKRKTAVCTASSDPAFIDLFTERFSDYDRMLRVTAYCRRFIENCRRNPTNSPSTYITTKEKNAAEATLIRLVQQQEFAEEWKQLQKSQHVTPKSRLRWFHPFISDDQLIRIGGRLNQAPQPYDSKHQIILPASHSLSKLLVRSQHKKHLHAAPQLLVSILRLRYWITGARNLARTTVRNCIECVKARPQLLEQFMAELPASRVTAARPFSVTGVDYWGPISLQRIHRRAAPRKAYVAVFVCFVTRAVHLELVIDLSTVKFLQALRRFVSRRGLCSDIYSDNGRNFIGAANELRKLVRSKEHQQAVAEECASHRIRWHFNPPKASHFGGLWEAAIHSAQKHFVRVLGTHTLAEDDMETLLAQIECCLNSRPLIALSDDPTDFETLTPGHFLVGSALKAIPDTDFATLPSNRLRQWEQVQKMLQLIWKRWHSEYLSSLQPRTKWCNPPIAIKLNQLVLIKDENTPPMAWPTARVVEIHPGTDGIVRVVSVQTPTGRFIRPVSKICLLPIPPTQETFGNQAAAANESPSATTSMKKSSSS
ncbi:uncharacterized protein LOC115267934 [Aedes albopictus]|uniref:Endonuclease n=1 Tax=Aedes albopictus TaxID=7160 RepID=A0ABM1ZIL4_AEDAL